MREALPFVDAAGMAAATGLSSTVADMARFVSWQLRLLETSETEVLSASTLREMQRVQWLQPDWKSGWGIGFGITHTADRDLIGHGGGYPGYLTSTRISPKERVGVIVFTNSLDGEPQLISDRIFDWVAPAIVNAVEDGGALQPDSGWRKFEGTYRNIWGDSHVLALDGRLAMINPRLANPKPDAFTLEPDGQGAFKLEGNGSAAIGERVSFELGPEGVATRMFVGDGWSERVSYPV
jgi:CubicO group peptidase (beta-lactamase class C family)